MAMKMFVCLILFIGLSVENSYPESEGTASLSWELAEDVSDTNLDSEYDDVPENEDNDASLFTKLLSSGSIRDGFDPLRILVHESPTYEPATHPPKLNLKLT